MYKRQYRELPEHVAVELEFMYYLAAMEARMLKQDLTVDVRTLEKSFLELHLARWVETFAQCVIKNAKLNVYRSSAKLLSKTIKGDLEFLRWKR